MVFQLCLMCDSTSAIHNLVVDEDVKKPSNQQIILDSDPAIIQSKMAGKEH